MPEQVYIDLTPGLGDIPAELWANIDPHELHEHMRRQVPRDRRDQDFRSLRHLIQEMQPAHVTIEDGGWTPESPVFQLLSRVLPPERLRLHFDMFANSYLNETYEHGTNQDMKDAIGFIQERRKLLGLDIPEKPRPSRTHRFLSFLGIHSLS